MMKMRTKIGDLFELIFLHFVNPFGEFETVQKNGRDCEQIKKRSVSIHEGIFVNDTLYILQQQAILTLYFSSSRFVTL